LNPSGAYAVGYFACGDVGSHGGDLADRFVTENSGKLFRNVPESFVYVGIADAICAIFTST